jgi:hypothetical protein
LSAFYLQRLFHTAARHSDFAPQGRSGDGACRPCPTSHNGKALTHILDTFPRDELFQISTDELYVIATGILHMGGLPRLKLFLRFDRFDRFVSACWWRRAIISPPKFAATSMPFWPRP